jgi:hypothetical protein
MTAGEPVVLRREQVLGAAKLCAGLADLTRRERALHALQGCFPTLDNESTVLKVLALRAVDSGPSLAVTRVAAELQAALANVDLGRAGPELVDRIALLPSAPAHMPLARRLGFASRFAHYFVDLDRFPVLEAWSERALAVHVARGEVPGESRYVRFANDFARLATQIDLKRRRELARYLWLEGQYHAWHRNPRAAIHRGVRALFEASQDAVQLLFHLPIIDEPPPALPAERAAAANCAPLLGADAIDSSAVAQR